MSEAIPRRVPRNLLTRSRLRKLWTALGRDPATATRRWAQLRQRIEVFFDNNRCLDPAEFADRTLDVLARVVAEKTISDIDSYALGVARNLLHDARRVQAAAPLSLEELGEVAVAAPSSPDPEDAEAVPVTPPVECARRCRDRFSKEYDLFWLYTYPDGDAAEERRRMADRLGLSGEGLRTRVHRIRARLEDCVTRCLAER